MSYIEILMIIFGSIPSIILIKIYLNSRGQKRVMKKKIKPILMMTDEELREEIEKQEIRTQELTEDNLV